MIDNSEPLKPPATLYPVDPKVLTQTELEARNDIFGLCKAESAEIRTTQPTILKILERFNLIGPGKSAQEISAILEGAGVAYRLFKNQARLYGGDIPTVPPELEDSVMGDYSSDDKLTRDKTDNFPVERILGHKIKASQEELHETLLFMSQIKPKDEMTWVRFKGAIVTAYIFKAIQDREDFSRQIKI